VRRAGEWLYDIQDEFTGRVPCYGQNDGALLLPLNNCDHQDFRPVIQSTCYLGTGTRRFPDGPWDEDLLWLFGPQAVQAPNVAAEREDLKATDGGYYTLRGSRTHVFVRCANLEHRPGQADMLHVDLWWQGQNVALDPGVFSYNAREPWNNPLSHTAYHNTVTVDGLSQMDRVGKFLWLPWLTGKVRYQRCSPRGHLAYWEGEHDGYGRLKSPVNHRRGILRLGTRTWLVVDGLIGRAQHCYRLHWLLLGVPHTWEEGSGRLTLHTSAGPYHVQLATEAHVSCVSLVRADVGSPRGWRARGYGSREPALSLDLATSGSSARFWTLFGPEVCNVDTDGSILTVKGERWRATARLEKDGQLPLISSVFLSGTSDDSLRIS